MPNEAAIEDSVMNRVMNVLNHEIELLELEVKSHADHLTTILKPNAPEAANAAPAPMDGEEVSQLSDAILALASRIRQQRDIVDSLDKRMDL